ncbi:MAG: RNA-binding S4 domain-containing protein [Pseudomonadota bacterium]
MTDIEQLNSMRLDKWLWAARFFKTRPLASAAVGGGKVRLNGQRCKPSRMIESGNLLTVQKGNLIWEVTVQSLPKQRRPARETHLYYTETPESEARRQAHIAQMQAEKAAYTPSEHRPDKRNRRLIHAFQRAAYHHSAA